MQRLGRHIHRETCQNPTRIDHQSRNFEVGGGISELWGQPERYGHEHVADILWTAQSDGLAVEISLVEPAAFYLDRHHRSLYTSTSATRWPAWSGNFGEDSTT